MEIKKVNIDELISPSYNPREITPEEMEKLKTSITEFGYCDPIIVNKVNNHIVGGNQRYEAMKQLGYTEFEVSYVNIPDLNREKALNIRLNNLSGEWDMTKLEKIIDEFKMEKFDITLTGFGDFELDFYLDNDTDDFFNPFDDDESDLDYEDETPDDYMDVEGERTNEQYVVSISFTTREDANIFLKYINAPYELKQRSVGIHESEIFEDWRED